MTRTSTHPSVYVIRLAALFAVAASGALGITYFVGDTTFCDGEGGCAQVRHVLPLTDLLPMIGLVAFTTLFVSTLFTGRTARRALGAMTVAGATLGLALLLTQAFVIGHFCWLCVVTDTAAIVAGIGGVWLLRAPPDLDEPSSSIASLWWAPFPIALLGPFVLVFTVVVPDEVTELFDDDADVNIVEMADFECPFCRALHPVLRDAIAASEHDVHLARVMVPLPFHPHARDAAKAYFCVGDARADAMADRLFATDDLSIEGVRREAVALGVDGDAFDRCVADPATEARIVADETRARDAGMQGLPTVYIGLGVVVGFDADAGAAPYEEAIEAAAAGRGSRYRPWPAILMIAGVLLALITARPRRPPRHIVKSDANAIEPPR